MSLNPVAWCAWAAAALAVAFVDRNPYLQLVLLMVILNVWLPYRGGLPGGFWKLGALLAVTPIVFSVALSRFGQHVLVRLPDIPILGGVWTLEALVFGASTGVALLLIVAVFGVVQTTVRSADLVSRLPPYLYRAGTIFVLAVAFAPQTVAAIRSISEARRLRGQRSGWRAAPALLVPLLLTTLERAMQYAESLDARGYGSRHRSRYRRASWRPSDYLILAASTGSLLLVMLLPPTPYTPYQDLIPIFPTLAAFAPILLLAMPALLSATQREHRVADLV